MERENRSLRGAELRAAAGNRLSGYAAVFDSEADIGGQFTEVVRAGAFARAIREKQDVRCLFNHSADIVLGRTKSGTLELAEDETGLHFDCRLPDSQAARDVLESVRRGDIDGCSFGFRVRKQQWSDRPDGTLRELLDVDLADISPVTFPAYQGTSVSARSLWPDGVPRQIRLRTQAPERISGAGCYTLRIAAPVRTNPTDPLLELERCRAKVRLALLD